MTERGWKIGARTHTRRIRCAQVAFTVLAVAYGVRLVQLQAVQVETWRRAAAAQHAAQVELPARRGAILDRDGRPLVLESEEFRAYLAPRELKDPRRAAAAAARILGLSRPEERKLASARDGWVAIPRRVSDAERERLRAAIRRGLHFERISSRTFPEGRLARSLLGAVDGTGRGISGLEMVLDSVLRGRPGAVLTRRDAIGGTYWLPDAQLAVPRPGQDVLLTLDTELQGIAENALERALTETGASGGDILLLDPRSGEILAVASHRGARSLRVPAFTDPYEPGSTLKPFLLAALLAEHLVRLSDVVDVEGGRLREGRRLIQDVHPRDTLTVAEVIRFSSNVGAVKLSRKLEEALHYRYLRDFGFGVPTGVEYPAESGGRLRKPSQWSALSQTSLAMGYEISSTSIQLAAAYGALANDGRLMQPFLVKEVRRADGSVRYRHRPRAVRRVVSPQVARAVTEVLASVVTEGTATRAALQALEVAGKTGTARLIASGRYDRGRYAASFVGYTPANDPSLVILTKLEDPQGAFYGGTVAAPVSQAALRAALATRGALLRPRLAAGRPPPVKWGDGSAPRAAGRFVFAVGGGKSRWPEPASAAMDSRVLPDLRGLTTRAAVARLHALGLHVELKVLGKVRKQVPGPGRRVMPGATILLR
ncbi:MAG: penicillin-binding transpeptidase domain-containing protein [Gemmatimonadota bacterium]